jgi:hypothetical protein
VRRRAAVALAVALAGAACSGDPEPGRDETRTAAADRSGGAATGFPFRDVTAESGVDFVHDNGAVGRHHYPETMGPGVALLDVDGDGDLDLFVVDSGSLPGDPRGVRAANDRLFLNRGDGTFEPAPASSVPPEDRGYGMGVTVGDYDGDGRPDLYVMNYGPNRLLRNAGGGRFETVSAGVEDPAWSVSGAFFDVDADGDLDLYVADYIAYDVETEGPCRAGDLEIYCSPEQFPPVQQRLYRNDGGRFTDVSREYGVRADGRGMGVAAGDVDGDGYTDLYVANDRTMNFLYLNRGGRRFEEVGTESGVAHSEVGMAEGGMGVVIADLSGRGGAEVFFTNFQKEPNRYFVPAAGGFWQDETMASGLGFPSLEKVGWGIAALDVEGDGLLDLAVANGHVFENAEEFLPGSSYAMADDLFRNRGNGSFDRLEFPGPPLSSRGLAAGDLDGDGDPDLVIAACGDRLRVWRNEAGEPERFLVVELRGKPPNTDAFGSTVTASASDRTLRRQLHGGGSYASHSDQKIVLGLGDHGRAERVEVRWPDGTVEEAADLAGGQRLVWSQGEGIVERRALARGGARRALAGAEAR